MVQTADGTLNDVEQMLQRVRELAVEYGNGTNASTDQTAIQSEVNQLTTEITRVGRPRSSTASTCSPAASRHLPGRRQRRRVDLGHDRDVVGPCRRPSPSAGRNTLSTIDGYINNVSAQAADFGAVQNRLGYTLDNLSTYSENLTAAQCNIQDVDMASEETTFTKDQILEQAGVSMLAQANQDPQMILKLLG